MFAMYSASVGTDFTGSQVVMLAVAATFRIAGPACVGAAVDGAVVGGFEAAAGLLAPALAALVGAVLGAMVGAVEVQAVTSTALVAIRARSRRAPARGLAASAVICVPRLGARVAAARDGSADGP